MNDESETSQNSSLNQLTVHNDKLHSLQNLYKTVEDLAYIQVACLYYVDNSTLLTLLRASTIVNIIPYTSKHRLLAVLLLNVGCISAHLINGRPAPVIDGARMLSGGLLVDFCGEYAYPSKVKLVVLDLIILIIMLMMLLIANEKTKSQADAEKPQEIVVDPRILEEGRQGGDESADTENEDGTLLADKTSQESVRLLEINIARGIRDIVADPIRSDTVPASRNQETLRVLLAAIAARATRRQ